MIATSLLAALDPARSPGELALALAGVAALLALAWATGRLLVNDDRKDG